MIIKRLLLCLLVCLAIGCSGAVGESASDHVDYAGQLKLDMQSETVKTEVSVKTFIDGDTTHFLVPTEISPDGVLRARYLAVNTPESTGKIEEYGKRASDFTKEKLSAASSILIESDSETWNLDSTGARHLVWVWYLPEGETDYRCLNLELLQNGLCIANSTANNRYGSTCMAALNQAKAEKLNLYSGNPDPDFYYGDAIELTLRELRTNLASYNGKKVAFQGVATSNLDQVVSVEAFDAETGLLFGMPVYYGYGLSGAGLEILTVGNEVRIVGTLQYYEAADTWQVSGLNYRMMKPNDPGNIQKLSDGHLPAYAPITAMDFALGSVALETEDGKKTFSRAELAIATSVAMDNLLVAQIAEEQDGWTLLCTQNDVAISVKTPLLYENGTPISAERCTGKTLRVEGIIQARDDAYQIRVLSPEHITIIDTEDAR